MTTGSKLPPRRLDTRVARWLAPLGLALLVVLPYHRLLTLDSVVITDDVFASDIANWEFPFRAAIGEKLRAGESITWLPEVCGGYPALAGSGATDPLSLGMFSILPPVAAINYLLLGLLVLAASGTYAYARRLGASRSAALLAGLCYAYSGYMVSQLRRVAAATVAAWLPIGLLLVERISRPQEQGRRDLGAKVLAAVALALVFGLQVLAGFPQTAYYSALVYLGAAAVRGAAILVSRRGQGWQHVVVACLLVGFALLLGAGLGSPSLLPMNQMGQTSDRIGGLSWEEVNRISYWPPNAWTFLRPYLHGDASDLSYTAHSLFWEDYGYLGLLPFLLAIGVLLLRRRDPKVMGHGLLAIVAFTFVLGPATPLFRLYFDYLPGMGFFRLPTRMLFVVTLALAILGALGLSALQSSIAGCEGRRRRLAAIVGLAVVAITYGDLVYHQMRQNALVDADRWMAAPATVARLDLAEHPPARVVSLAAGREHIGAFQRAQGWSGDLEHYVDLRALLQPNINLHWGVPSLGCYMSILPRWVVDTLGDRSRPGLLDRLFRIEENRLVAGPPLARLLRLLHTEYVVAPLPLEAPGFEKVGNCDEACVYRVTDPLPRAWIVPRGLQATGADDILRILGPEFDPRYEVLLHGEPALVAQPRWSESVGMARIEEYGTTEVRIHADAGDGGYLILADTWYPGWQVEIDGEPGSILRANLMTRAVPLDPGQHEVRFFYAPVAVAIGLRLAAFSALLLLAAACLALRSSQTRELG